MASDASFKRWFAALQDLRLVENNLAVCLAVEKDIFDRLVGVDSRVYVCV